jgi:hypothetical protein
MDQFKKRARAGICPVVEQSFKIVELVVKL